VVYRLLPVAGDPLGYLGDPVLAEFVCAGWHDSRDWLAVTADNEFPDFVPQIADLFDSPRAGDILAFAAADWSFSLWHAGGHGSALARDMRVSMFVSGPDLPPGSRITHARLVDVAPTILDLLGQRGPAVSEDGHGEFASRAEHSGPSSRSEALSGRSLAEELRAARP
jgi:arylsulfatase A-like enzyme